MHEQFLIKKFSEYGKVSKSGEIYLPIVLVKNFIDECSKLSVSIIGIEFFHKKGDYIIPVTPINSIDCSSIVEKNSDWKVIVNDCNSTINNILELELNGDITLYFNPTLLEEEWKNAKQ